MLTQGKLAVTQMRPAAGLDGAELLFFAASAERLSKHHAAAALGGIVWALGGYMTANLEFMSVMETLAWCPLTVLLACLPEDLHRTGLHLALQVQTGAEPWDVVNR